MAFDIVIKGGRIVDGSGLRSYIADLAIADGRIARIGRIDDDAGRIIDATGKWVTPGFIDVHTHYDVQLDWDPLATPSSWHGIRDRGWLREGAHADVLVIDPERLAADAPRTARDFPADSERYVVDAHGYEFVIVNGEVLLEDGKHTGALPGRVLRGG